MSLSVDFRGLASCSFGDGTSVSFWEDIWDMGLLKLEFPHLYSFAKDTKISVATFLSRDIKNNFLLLLSIEASMQLTELAGRILNIHGNSHGTDCWTYQWGSTFSCKQAYSAIQGIMPKQVQFTWLWKSSCRGSINSLFGSSWTDSIQGTCLKEIISLCHLITVFFVKVMWKKR